MDIISLINQTESMDQYEKKYWIDILPRMEEEQIQRLKDILETERDKLADLSLYSKN